MRMGIGREGRKKARRGGYRRKEKEKEKEEIEGEGGGDGRGRRRPKRPMSEYFIPPTCQSLP